MLGRSLGVTSRPVMLFAEEDRSQPGAGFVSHVPSPALPHTLASTSTCRTYLPLQSPASAAGGEAAAAGWTAARRAT